MFGLFGNESKGKIVAEQARQDAEAMGLPRTLVDEITADTLKEWYKNHPGDAFHYKGR